MWWLSFIDEKQPVIVNKRKDPRFLFDREVATTLSSVDTRVIDLSSSWVLLHIDNSQFDKILPIWIKPISLKVNWTIHNEWVVKRSQMLSTEVIEIAVEFKQRVNEKVFWSFLWQYWWNRVEKDKSWEILWKYKITWRTIHFEGKGLSGFVREVMNLVKTWLYDTINISKMEVADSFIYAFLSKVTETTNIKIIYNWNSNLVLEYLTLFKVPYSKK